MNQQLYDYRTMKRRSFRTEIAFFCEREYCTSSILPNEVGKDLGSRVGGPGALPLCSVKPILGSKVSGSVESDLRIQSFVLFQY